MRCGGGGGGGGHVHLAPQNPILVFSCWLIYSQSLSTLCPTVKIREAVK